MIGSATAQAGINIALIKYWGKRDAALNLPAVGSLSLTLEGLGSTTTVRFDAALGADSFHLNGQQRDDPRVVRLLDGVRQRAGITHFAEVRSENTVPTAAGLASSASGAAALGLAAWAAAGLPKEAPHAQPDLVRLVRQASGSGPRSLLGGLVLLDKMSGEPHGLCDLAETRAWQLALVVCGLAEGEKAVSSRAGMARTAQTSPYYDAWVAQHEAELVRAQAAVRARDLPALGAAMERSTARMHAAIWAADPPLRYLSARSFAAFEAVEALRAQGVGAWATADAGPHVKVLCQREELPAVRASLAQLPGLRKLWVLEPGAAARWLPEARAGE